MAIQRYHAVNNWEKKYLPHEDIENILFFGFELEVERKNDIDSPCCDVMTDIIDDYLGEYNLFIYEHDGSLDDGFEIISHPMSFAYYEENISIFKTLLDLLKENSYESHNSGTCGLHVHINWNYFGFSKEEKDNYINNHSISLYDMERLNNLKIEETIDNCNFIYEKFREDFIKLSGRNSFNYCNFLLNNIEYGNQPKLNRKDIKERAKNTNRYRVVNLTNRATIEFRLMRGTLLFKAFDTRIRVIKNIVETAKKQNGIYSLSDIMQGNGTDEIKATMRSYFEDRGIADIDDKYISLLANTYEFRPDNINFALKSRGAR